MIGRLALLHGDASPLGAAHAGLGVAAREANEDDLAQEYFDLFAGLGGGSLLPYSSHYLTGAVYGRPLARLRETLWHLGIEKAAGHSEPEDHSPAQSRGVNMRETAIDTPRSCRSMIEAH
jgi:TorA maturation chaperone TorD